MFYNLFRQTFKPSNLFGSINRGSDNITIFADILR